MELDSSDKLSHTTRGLHWLIALTIIALWGVGWYMATNKVYPLYSWHKSFGILVVLFAVVRVGWRIKNGWPSALPSHQQWERALSKLVHWLLIISTLLMPLSGMLMSAMGGHGLQLFGLELFPHNPMPDNPQRNMPINKELAELFHSVHGIAAKLLLVSLVLHVAGALKHHVIDKDNTLKRMLGR